MHSLRTMLRGAGFAALLVLCPALATAQTSDRERAAELVEQAREAEARDDFAAAAVLWHEAFRLSNDPALAFNLAVYYDGEGDIARAWFYATQYLDLFPGAPDREEVESFVAEWQRALPTETAQLQVESVPAGAGVYRIGDEIEEYLGETPLATWITPGTVTLELRSEGFVPHEERFNSVAGLRVPLDVRLEALPAEDSVAENPGAITTDATPGIAQTVVAEPPSRVSGIALTSAGSGLLIAALPFGLSANSAAEDYNELVRGISPTEESTEVVERRSQRLSDLEGRHNLMRGLMWGSVGAGTVLTGVGLYLLLRPASASTDAAWHPANFHVGPTPGGGAATWSWTF